MTFNIKITRADICARAAARPALRARTALGATLKVAVLAVALGGCAARLPEPSPADARRAARLWPGTTVTDLDRGKQRYVQSCSGCHGLIDPRQFPSGRWPAFVKEMAGRSRMSSGDMNDLTRYLVVAAQAPAGS